jgi:DNA polymerase-4
VGAARTKFLAKVASGVAKPDGLLVVPPDRELAFLHPLPIERLWGVGPATAGKLRAFGVATVGQVARIPEPALTSMLGSSSGHRLHALAHNTDPRPVRSRPRRRSFGAQHALGRGRKRYESVEASLLALVDRVSRRLRGAGRVGRTVTLRLRFEDFSRATRSRTLSQATAHTPTLAVALRELLAASWPRIEQDGITLVGVSVGNLDDDEAVQLALPFDRRSSGVLDTALDELRHRFGSTAITRASLLGRDSGVEMPVLADRGEERPH